ncbi:MAG: PAS domain-containing protein [Fervidobacterium sp.]
MRHILKKRVVMINFEITKITVIHGFSDGDQQLLARYELLAESIARIFGNGCEVVLYSLEDMAHPVIKIYKSRFRDQALNYPSKILGLKFSINPFRLEMRSSAHIF